MSASSPPRTGRLLAFDPLRRKPQPPPLVVDAGDRYEDAMQALLDVLDEEDAHLVDELDAAVAYLLATARIPPHPSQG